jgi:hypothetical protein
LRQRKLRVTRYIALQVLYLVGDCSDECQLDAVDAKKHNSHKQLCLMQLRAEVRYYTISVQGSQTMIDSPINGFFRHPSIPDEELTQLLHPHCPKHRRDGLSLIPQLWARCLISSIRVTSPSSYVRHNCSRGSFAIMVKPGLGIRL